MKLTKHAKMRIRQRGLPEILPAVLQAWGCLEQAPGGTERIFLGKKEANRLRNEVAYEYQRVLELIDRCTNRNTDCSEETTPFLQHTDEGNRVLPRRFAGPFPWKKPTHGVG